MVLDSGVETPTVRERHHPDDTGRRHVHVTAAADLRDGPAGATRRDCRHQAGVPYKDVHLLAAASFATDLKAAGLMKGDAGEAVAAGAHALFFPHGLGHMNRPRRPRPREHRRAVRGLRAGVERSQQFGLGYLRLARS